MNLRKISHRHEPRQIVLTETELKNINNALYAALIVLDPKDHPGQYAAIREGLVITGHLLSRES